MDGPIFSPDGKWMWSGSEWIPAPPPSKSPKINLQDSVVAGDLNLVQNDPDTIAAAMVQALDKMGFSRHYGVPSVPAEKAPVRQVFLPNVGSAMMQPQTPEVAQMRRDVGDFSPEQLREFMAYTAYGPRPGETQILIDGMGSEEATTLFPPTQRVIGPELSERERQFQQTFGDPKQRLLTQYMWT